MKKTRFSAKVKGTFEQRIYIAVIVFLTVIFIGFIQSSCNTISSSNDDALNTEAKRNVLATDDRRSEALRRGNAEPLREIYADDYTLVTPSGVIRSKDDQINDLISGRVRYGKIEIEKRTVRVYGDVAIVLSRDKYDILQDGKQVGGDVFFTRTYKKFGTEWRVIATHGSFVKR